VEELRCGSCDSTDIQTTQEKDLIYYGEPGPNQAVIPCMVTVLTCKRCNWAWMDATGEDERAAAIAKWLASNPYQCGACCWKGSRPKRPRFGVVECPACDGPVSINPPVILAQP
jgi:hypothetical protein